MLATRGEGHVEFHAAAEVTELQSLGPDKGFRVLAPWRGSPNPGTSIASSPASGFKQTPSSRANCESASRSIHPVQRRSNRWPNYFVLGAKSHGRCGEFLLTTGFGQVRAAFAGITGRSDPFGGASARSSYSAFRDKCGRPTYPPPAGAATILA